MKDIEKNSAEMNSTKKNKKDKKKHPVRRKVLLGILALIVVAACVYCRFGGFGTGKCADVDDFAMYADEYKSDEHIAIEIPEETRIVALGEATHGNKEFQWLKHDVFNTMVEKYGVKAFVLEADTACCETANRYIHGGDGTAQEAANALGFKLYHTEEMANLLDWMRNYNKTAAEGEGLMFYGNDMQRHDEEEQMLDGKYELSPEFEVHLRDVLQQNEDLGKVDGLEMAYLRDKYMADNTMWVLGQEEKRGNKRIFVSAHNGHVDQNGCYNEKNPYMGRYLADEIGKDKYFVIGTDYYKTTDNLPAGQDKRTTKTFYSHDPLAKAAKKCGYEMCWLDFSKIPEGSALHQQVTDYCWNGSLGEVDQNFLNATIMKLMPQAYTRIWASPALEYDGMIFVTNAHPTEIV